MQNDLLIEEIESAFRQDVSSRDGVCHCGRKFMNSDGGWDWDDGEFDNMRKDGFEDIPYAIGWILLEGKGYIDSCNCWHKRAKIIGRFLLTHRDGIASFLNSERELRLAAAQSIKEIT